MFQAYFRLWVRTYDKKIQAKDQNIWASLQPGSGPPMNRSRHMATANRIGINFPFQIIDYPKCTEIAFNYIFYRCPEDH